MSISHKIYVNTIPDGLSGEIDNLYRSAYSTEKFINLHNRNQDINYFVIFEDGKIAHVLIYRMARHELFVLNHFYNIEEHYLEYFAHTAFKDHKRIKAISLGNMFNQLSALRYPFKPWRVKQDFIVTLPDNFDAYQAMLGKRTRTNLRYYHNKIRRDFQDFSFSVQASDVIDPDIASRIIELNRMRMKSMKITSVYDADYEQKIIALAKEYGVVGFLRADDKIIAGAICYRVGSECYAHIIAHDFDYSKYSLGMLCNYLLIEELIRRGVRHFHLDTGEMEFKYRLLAVEKTTYNYTIFRNSAYKILGTVIYLKKNEYVSRLINFINFKIIQNIKHSLASSNK